MHFSVSDLTLANKVDVYAKISISDFEISNVYIKSFYQIVQQLISIDEGINQSFWIEDTDLIINSQKKHGIHNVKFLNGDFCIFHFQCENQFFMEVSNYLEKINF